MTSKMDRARAADNVASRLMDAFTRALTWAVRDPRAYALAVLAADDDRITDRVEFERRVRSQAGLSDREVGLLSLLGTTSVLPGEDLVQLLRWSQHKVIYAFDPDLTSALLDTDWSDVPIPARVLRELPYPNPMVVLPSPVYERVEDAVARTLAPAGYEGDLFEKYEAFIISGVRSLFRTSTSDPDLTGISLTFLATVVDERDKPLVGVFYDASGTARTLPAVEGMRVVVDVTSDATMSARREYARSSITTPLGTPGQDDPVARLSDRLVDLGLALVVYLTSHEADVSRPQPVKAARKKGQRAPSLVAQVGVAVGAALRASSRAASHASSSPTGRSVRAHVRRGHVRAVAYGPRHSLRKVMWIAPTVVNGRIDTTTVHLT